MISSHPQTRRTVPNELATLTFPSGTQQTNAEVAVDSSGRVAYAYRNSSLGGISVAWDRSGDGDFDDPAESFTLSTAGSLTALRVGQNDVGKVFVPKNGEILGEPTP